MNQGKITIALASLVIITIAIGFAKPSIFSYIYIAQAREIVDELKTDENQLSCLQQIPDTRENQVRLKDALSNVEQALHQTPRNTLALRLSGQIYCLSGKYQNAVQAFNKYLNIRGKDPLIHLETGLADLNRCCNSDREIERICESASEHLKIADASPADFLANGISSYKVQQYLASTNYFAWNSCLNGNSDPAADLMYGISSILAKDDRAFSTRNLNKLAIMVEQGTTIQEDQLYWIRVGDSFGKPIDQVPVLDSTAGVLWTSGPVGAIIHISDPGRYSISMRVLDKQPTPIQFRIEHNLSPIQEFELSAGDNSWQEVTSLINLEPGFHLIGVDFLNDGIVNGIDRNLYIDWIKISNNTVGQKQ